MIDKLIAKIDDPLILVLLGVIVMLFALVHVVLKMLKDRDRNLGAMGDKLTSLSLTVTRLATLLEVMVMRGSRMPTDEG